MKSWEYVNINIQLLLNCGDALELDTYFKKSRRSRAK